MSPEHPEANFQLACLLERKGASSEAATHFDRATRSHPAQKDAFMKLAALQSRAGQTFDAIMTLHRAEQSYPDDPNYTYARGRLAARETPLWHLPMLADTARNDAYQSAISARIRPGDIVLDIGTGSGLLAMMAARAGAKHVYACEAHPVLAQLAHRIVHENGFAETITIIPKHSTALQVGSDLPERADVLVTEIFDNALIGEGILPTIRHAWSALLKPDAKIIPDKGVIYGQLAEAPHLEAYHSVGEVSGFDLSQMNALSHPLSYKDIDFNFEAAPGCKILSDPFELWSLDLTQVPDTIKTQHTTPTITMSGNANALVMWFDIHLDRDNVFSTRQTQPHQHWRRVAQLLKQPCHIAPHGPAELVMQYDRYFEFSLSAHA